jgi:hypothetical protein
LIFALSPDSILMLDFGTLRSLARNSVQQALAAPSTGGDVILIFKRPSYMPQSWFFDARG